MAKAASSPKKDFYVVAKVTAQVSIPVAGSSFEEVAAKVSSLKIEDFITIDGEYWDSEKPTITNIYIGD